MASRYQGQRPPQTNPSESKEEAGRTTTTHAATAAAAAVEAAAVISTSTTAPTAGSAPAAAPPATPAPSDTQLKGGLLVVRQDRDHHVWDCPEFSIPANRQRLLNNFRAWWAKKYTSPPANTVQPPTSAEDFRQMCQRP